MEICDRKTEPGMLPHNHSSFFSFWTLPNSIHIHGWLFLPPQKILFSLPCVALTSFLCSPCSKSHQKRFLSVLPFSVSCSFMKVQLKYPTMYIFKVYNLIGFDMCILRDHYHSHDNEAIHNPQEFPSVPFLLSSTHSNEPSASTTPKKLLVKVTGYLHVPESNGQSSVLTLLDLCSMLTYLFSPSILTHFLLLASRTS